MYHTHVRDNRRNSRQGREVCGYVCVYSATLLCPIPVTVWTVAHQAPLFMRFSRQEYWSGLPCPPPGDLSDSEIEPTSLKSPALAGGFFH